MNKEKLGRIVWHDLFTCDALASKSFYGGVAGWDFVVEHATEFAWGGGESDFILALSGEEAGAGFVEQPNGQFSGWVPYVEVDNVETTAVRAQEIGGSVKRAPFDVPGVGRNCLLCDPMEGLIGICSSRHNFPTPTLQFGAERYVARSKEFPADFYHELFDWNSRPSENPKTGHRVITMSEKLIAVHKTDKTPSDGRSFWAPGIRVKDLSAALRKVCELEGSIVSPDSSCPSKDDCLLVGDPNSTLCYLIT